MNSRTLHLLKEAVVVGIMTIIIGSVVGYMLGKLNKVELHEMCKQWNKNHIMEISLFFTGFFIHVLCEYSGLNKWYCTNGVACK